MYTDRRRQYRLSQAAVLAVRWVPKVGTLGPRTQEIIVVPRLGNPSMIVGEASLSLVTIV